jgi:hypothetical protein
MPQLLAEELRSLLSHVSLGRTGRISFSWGPELFKFNQSMLGAKGKLTRGLPWKQTSTDAPVLQILPQPNEKTYWLTLNNGISGSRLNEALQTFL